MSEKKICVIGGGSWATALTKILTDNNNSVVWWMRDQEIASFIQAHRFNNKYLRMAHLEIANLIFEFDLSKAVQQSDIIIIAVPSAYLEDSLQGIHPDDFREKIVVSAIKGMHPKSDRLVTEYIHSEFGIDFKNLAVIAGPCHAEEVAMEQMAYLTIAGENQKVCKEIASLLQRPNIFVTTLDDRIGAEYAAVLKNIYAVLTGISQGLGQGDNFKAVLVSNACTEMSRFLQLASPCSREITHSVYIGDLLVTCFSQHSRNRTFGTMIGQGYSVQSAQLEMNMVAEGYYASRSINHIKTKLNLEMPIATGVYEILYEGINPRKILENISTILY